MHVDRCLYRLRYGLFLKYYIFSNVVIVPSENIDAKLLYVNTITIFVLYTAESNANRQFRYRGVFVCYYTGKLARVLPTKGANVYK